VFDSDTTTHDVRVTVRAQYLPQRSRPDLGQWFFVYTVRITNVGDRPVRLRRRHWIIEDAQGRTEHVRGSGVVGKEPRLEPGQAFEYTSFCPLPSPTGSMQGTYYMEWDDGTGFDVEVTQFELSEPMAYN
jgi:ApaG protein